MEEVSIFKSYLRNLLFRLEELKKAIETKDNSTAIELVNKLIEDSKKGVED